jgi:hypothetical protein
MFVRTRAKYRNDQNTSLGFVNTNDVVLVEATEDTPKGLESSERPLDLGCTVETRPF